jgi:type VI secretion system secreted protein VgrG
VFAGGASVNSQMPILPEMANIYSRRFDFSQHFEEQALEDGIFYKIINHAKKTEIIGKLDRNGRTTRIFSDAPEGLEILILGDSKEFEPSMMEHPAIDESIIYDHDVNDTDDSDSDEQSFIGKME